MEVANYRSLATVIKAARTAAGKEVRRHARFAFSGGDGFVLLSGHLVRASLRAPEIGAGDECRKCHAFARLLGDNRLSVVRALKTGKVLT